LLHRVLTAIAGALIGCTSLTIQEDPGPSPVPMLTSDVFVLDRDQHLVCLSDCLDPDPDPTATYRSVRGSGRFSCAIRTDGRAECWGPHGFGDLVPDGRFRDATAYLGQACGITEDGAVRCWGEDGEAMAGNAPPGSWDQIETTEGGYCVWSAVDGAVGCFTRFGPGEVDYGYESFLVSRRVGCGLIGDGQVDCFQGISGFRAPRHFVQSFDLAAYYQCVLMMETRAHKAGTLICSGDEPVPEGRFAQISMYGPHGCVVTAEDEVVCWGGDWETPTSFGTFP
jgi:hypothetical protein